VSEIVFNRDELRDRIYGCWLGKNIGGTLGGPFEGRREVLNVTGYSTPAGAPLPNDDLDLQLVWLKAVQDRGPLGINSKVLGEYWLNLIPPPWNEYGINKSNQRAGLVPPLSGMYRNPWKHSNGAWIRSEIWACLTPGCPDVAIRFAYEDASVDHGGAEGMYAELFTAAVQSAAFVTQDRDELIRIGLARVPEDCRVARSIGIVLKAHAEGASWQDARDRVVTDSMDLGWFMAPANVAFVIIGWMYGEGDFGKSLCIAVSCGDDTDCTGATLGATLGIILGKSGIPAEWSGPLGDRIVTIAIDRGSYWGFPATLGDLTEQVMQQIPAALTAFRCPVRIADSPTDLSAAAGMNLASSGTAPEIWGRSSYAVVHDFVHTRVTLDYQRDPVIRANEPFTLTVELKNLMPDHRHLDLAWRLPEDWAVYPGQCTRASLLQDETRKLSFTITAPALSQASYRGILEITATGRPTVGLVPLLFLNEA
jgi:hypothetical protein